MVDPGIHVMGWTRQQAIDYMLENTALGVDNAIYEIDRYAAVPGQATSYLLGSLEIQRLRAHAESLLGDRFDIKAFHDRVLENGTVTLPMLATSIDAWIEEQDFKDPDTGQIFDREILDTELSKIEKPAGVANSKDFRNEVVKFALRVRANNDGHNPDWNSYEKLRDVIEKHMFSQVEELLPVISFGTKKDSDSDDKHRDFVRRMSGHGYTERQVRRLVEWYMRVNKAG